jgi:hypothetical protein
MVLAPYTLEQAGEDLADVRGDHDALAESLTQTDGGTVPNTADPNSYTQFSAAGQPSYINDNGMVMEYVGAQLATVAPVTVTGAGSTTVAGLLVPGGDAIPGSTYKLTCFGYGVTGSTGASNTVTCQLSHGGVNGGLQTAGSSLFGTNAGFRFFIDAYLVCLTNGVGGTMLAYANWTMTAVGANILPTSVQAAAIAVGAIPPISVDTTGGLTFRIGLAWGATAGGPSLTVLASIPGKIA